MIMGYLNVQQKLSEQVKRYREKDPEYYRRKERLMNIEEVEAMYKRIYERQGQEAAIESVYNFYKEDTIVIYDVKVTPADSENASVVLYFNPSKGESVDPAKYRKIPCFITLRIHPPEIQYLVPPLKNKAERIARRKEYIKGLKKSAKRSLIKGHVLIWSAGNQLWSTLFEMDLRKIVKIMRNSSWSLEKKYKALSQIGVWNKEIIYDFVPQEWPDFEAEGGKK